MGKSFFTVRYTNMAKGIAILLLLFHHLGLNEDLGIFANHNFLINLAWQGKVCVSIFLILSGYGLNTSFNKHVKNNCDIKEYIRFTFKHLYKLMSEFWIIFIIFVSFGCLTNLRDLSIYGNHIIINLIIDFLGLVNIFQTPTYNATWWFMTLIILLYVSFPLLKRLLSRSPFALLLFGCILRFIPFSFNDTTFFTLYCLPFCLGMIFSEYSLFDKIKGLQESIYDDFIITIGFLIVGLVTRYLYDGIFDLFAAFSIIFACNSILSRIKHLNSFMELVGKNSGNIFMLHAFIYKYFFLSFFKQLNNRILMYSVLLVSSLIISILIHKSKDCIKHYFEMKRHP